MPALLLIALVLLLSGCGEEPGPGGGDRLRVVATTPHVADIARQVAGDRAEVTGLIPTGADPHDYEVRPSDVEALAEADVILRSGGEVDEWLQEAIGASGSDADVLDLSTAVETRRGGEHADEEHGEEADAIDPHWWQDPRNGARAAEAIARELGVPAPEYAATLHELDAAIEACWRRVPAAQRKLVTTHDALGYYADRYGLEVVGAVIPSTSTAGQASAGAVDRLVDTLRRERVQAIFAESGVSARVERAIAEEAGVRLGGELHTDTLAESGPASTYAGALAENTRRMVEGVSGGRVSCSPPR